MKLNKILMASAVVIAAASSTVASAAGVFTVCPTCADAGYTNRLGTFQSDYIAGNYQEVVTLTPTGAGGGTFAYSILWQGSDFELGGTAVVDPGFGTAVSTGLSNTYTLYATLYGTGTYTVSASGNPSQPNVQFNPDLGGSLSLFADLEGITVTNDFTTMVGGDAWTLGFIDNARPLLSGVVTAAEGNLKGDGVSPDFGSFGVQTTVNLINPDGENFFSDPRPFFNASFEAGNFNEYWLGTLGNDPVTSRLGGGAQITFDNVPEPASLALVGIALCGAALARRRRA
jgi:hypothetical protein